MGIFNTLSNIISEGKIVVKDLFNENYIREIVAEAIDKDGVGFISKDDYARYNEFIKDNSEDAKFITNLVNFIIDAFNRTNDLNIDYIHKFKNMDALEAVSEFLNAKNKTTFDEAFRMINNTIDTHSENADFIEKYVLAKINNYFNFDISKADKNIIDTFESESSENGFDKLEYIPNYNITNKKDLYDAIEKGMSFIHLKNENNFAKQTYSHKIKIDKNNGNVVVSNLWFDIPRENNDNIKKSKILDIINGEKYFTSNLLKDKYGKPIPIKDSDRASLVWVFDINHKNTTIRGIDNFITQLNAQNAELINSDRQEMLTSKTKTSRGLISFGGGEFILPEKFADAEDLYDYIENSSADLIVYDMRNGENDEGDKNVAKAAKYPYNVKVDKVSPSSAKAMGDTVWGKIVILTPKLGVNKSTQRIDIDEFYELFEEDVYRIKIGDKSIAKDMKSTVSDKEVFGANKSRDDILYPKISGGGIAKGGSSFDSKSEINTIDKTITKIWRNVKGFIGDLEGDSDIPDDIYSDVRKIIDDGGDISEFYKNEKYSEIPDDVKNKIVNIIRNSISDEKPKSVTSSDVYGSETGKPISGEVPGWDDESSISKAFAEKFFNVISKKTDRYDYIISVGKKNPVPNNFEIVWNKDKSGIDSIKLTPVDGGTSRNIKIDKFETGIGSTYNLIKVNKNTGTESVVDFADLGDTVAFKSDDEEERRSAINRRIEDMDLEFPEVKYIDDANLPDNISDFVYKIKNIDVNDVIAKEKVKVYDIDGNVYKFKLVDSKGNVIDKKSLEKDKQYSDALLKSELKKLQDEIDDERDRPGSLIIPSLRKKESELLKRIENNKVKSNINIGGVNLYTINERGRYSDTPEYTMSVEDFYDSIKNGLYKFELKPTRQFEIMGSLLRKVIPNFDNLFNRIRGNKNIKQGAKYGLAVKAIYRYVFDGIPFEFTFSHPEYKRAGFDAESEEDLIQVMQRNVGQLDRPRQSASIRYDVYAIDPETGNFVNYGSSKSKKGKEAIARGKLLTKNYIEVLNKADPENIPQFWTIVSVDKSARPLKSKGKIRKGPDSAKAISVVIDENGNEIHVDDSEFDLDKFNKSGSRHGKSKVDVVTRVKKIPVDQMTDELISYLVRKNVKFNKSKDNNYYEIHMPYEVVKSGSKKINAMSSIELARKVNEPMTADELEAALDSYEGGDDGKLEYTVPTAMLTSWYGNLPERLQNVYRDWLDDLIVLGNWDLVKYPIPEELVATLDSSIIKNAFMTAIRNHTQPIEIQFKNRDTRSTEEKLKDRKVRLAKKELEDIKSKELSDMERRAKLSAKSVGKSVGNIKDAPVVKSGITGLESDVEDYYGSVVSNKRIPDSLIDTNIRVLEKNIKDTLKKIDDENIKDRPHYGNLKKYKTQLDYFQSELEKVKNQTANESIEFDNVRDDVTDVRVGLDAERFNLNKGPKSYTVIYDIPNIKVDDEDRVSTIRTITVCDLKIIDQSLVNFDAKGNIRDDLTDSKTINMNQAQNSTADYLVYIGDVKSKVHVDFLVDNILIPMGFDDVFVNGKKIR